MEKFVIDGQFPVRGEVVVNGAKNAALPIMAASLLTTDECVIDNVPMVADVRTLAQILRSIGCIVDLDEAAHRVTVRAPKSPRSTQSSRLTSRRRCARHFL